MGKKEKKNDVFVGYTITTMSGMSQQSKIEIVVKLSSNAPYEQMIKDAKELSKMGSETACKSSSMPQGTSRGMEQQPYS